MSNKGKLRVKSGRSEASAEQAVLYFELDARKSFLDDLMRVPKATQKKILRAYGELKVAAKTPDGDTIKKLKGFETLWRYRAGDYRVIYAVHDNRVQLLAVGHRRDIYERFNYNPDAPNERACLLAEASLVPSSRAASRASEIDKWIALAEKQYASAIALKEANPRSPLPQRLTQELLTSWNIPIEHHAALLPCKTDQELQETDLPYGVLSRVIDMLYPKSVEQIAEQAVFTVDDPAQIEDYLETGLIKFLLKLDTEQEKLMDWGLDGPTMLKGGPGSGKSTITLYRIRSLVNRARTLERVRHFS